MKRKITLTTIEWLHYIVFISLICILLIPILFNKKTESVPETSSEVEISTETTTTSTNTTTTKKTAKKVVKTTTKKKTTSKSTKKINIKYNRQEVINYTYQRVVARWGEDQWDAVYNIVSHESGWNPNDWNKKSTACGLFQACPCSKTVKNGYKDYYTNWKTQVEWGLDYIQVKYKTPKNAWKHWKQHGNY